MKTLKWFLPIALALAAITLVREARAADPETNAKVNEVAPADEAQPAEDRPGGPGGRNGFGKAKGENGHGQAAGENGHGRGKGSNGHGKRKGTNGHWDESREGHSGPLGKNGRGAGRGGARGANGRGRRGAK